MDFPIEFAIFGLVLAGIAGFHRHTLPISLAGAAIVVALKWRAGFPLAHHFREEAGLLVNLIGLLLGFAALAKHFEASGLPALMPRLLPDDWKGSFCLLLLVFVLSTFLDNIAAALVGGTVAASVFRGRVSVGYLAALVAASNAGGAGSVLGDTTTTMLWIAGVPAGQVLHAFIGSGIAVFAFGIPAALRQHRYQPIQADPTSGARVDGKRVALVLTVLAGAVLANLWLDFPAAGVWAALLLWSPFVRFPFGEMPQALRGAVFLSALVLIASLMPVERLPAASWPTALGLGFVSAVFDNIPLTRLALEQGGYDWGILAYAVGYGGSLLWFGSSAGVALAAGFPEMRSIGKWLREGWYLLPAYVFGFFAMLAAAGWHPGALP